MSKIGKDSDQDFTGSGSTRMTGSNKSDPRGKTNNSENSGSSSDESVYATKSRTETDKSASVSEGEMKFSDKEVASGSKPIVAR